jgi:uncharacterized membrane protein
VKECPVCKAKTIPNQWILFGKSDHKNGYCIKCPNCQTNIRKKRWFIIDLLLMQEWVFFPILFLLGLAVFQITSNFTVAIAGAILLFILLLMGIAYFTPLREADEAYCRGEMTKIGAVLAWGFTLLIVIYTLYQLLYKPLIQG